MTRRAEIAVDVPCHVLAVASAFARKQDMLTLIVMANMPLGEFANTFPKRVLRRTCGLMVYVDRRAGAARQARRVET